MMRNILMAGLAALTATAACAQQVAAPQMIGAAQPSATAAMDPAPAAVMEQPPEAGGLKSWYAQQQRPALVVYFDRQLDRLPAGWRGQRRLLIEDSTHSANHDETRRITVGVQHNNEVAAADLSDFAKVFEQSLQNEMKRQQFRVLDGVILHRKQAAAGGANDIEYESLRKSARFVFEVQFVAIPGGVELIGSLKDLHSGDVPASVRVPVDSALQSADEIDRISRSLVQRLLKARVS